LVDGAAADDAVKRETKITEVTQPREETERRVKVD
jgi:hypothetical protein